MNNDTEWIDEVLEILQDDTETLNSDYSGGVADDHFYLSRKRYREQARAIILAKLAEARIDELESVCLEGFLKGKCELKHTITSIAGGKVQTQDDRINQLRKALDTESKVNKGGE